MKRCYSDISTYSDDTDISGNDDIGIFDALKEYSDDPFWDVILENLSSGITPKGFVIIDNNTLRYKTSSKSFEYASLETLKNFKLFISKWSGICSDRDREILKMSMDICNNQQKWTEIRKCAHKEVLVYRYLDRLIEDDVILEKNVEWLRSQLFIRINLGILNKDNIILRDGEIYDINSTTVDTLFEECIHRSTI